MFRSIAYFFVVVILNLLPSCQSTSLKPKQEINISFVCDPSSLDPRKGGDGVSTMLQFMLFEGLTKMSQGSATELGLAEKIEISEDKMTYTFYLKEAKWSDHFPICAQDFEYAWKELLSPDFPAPNANLLFLIKNAEKVKSGLARKEDVGVLSLDSCTLQVKLEHPTPYFLEMLAFCVFFPTPYHLTKTQQPWMDTNGIPLAVCGPFIIERWTKNYELLLSKNYAYWDSSRVSLKKIHVKIIEDDQTALRLFEKGELDIIGDPLSSIPHENIRPLFNEGKIHTTPLGATTFCSFNVNIFPFTNKNIRKAFAYAIDREAIVSHISGPLDQIADHPLPPSLFKKLSASLPYTRKDQAREYLKKGLEELNVTLEDIQDLSFIYYSGKIHEKIAQILQHDWLKNLGVRVTIEHLHPKVYYDKLYKKNYTFAYASWFAQYNDSMNIFDRFKYKKNLKNYPGWENSIYVSLLNASDFISDPVQRIKCLEEAEDVLINEMPFFSIYHWNQYYLKQEHLHGVEISPIGSIHFNHAFLH